MTDLALDIRDFLQRVDTLPVLDVRTPAEYEHAHIPGAVNMPLFSNEERSVIGTLYLKKGPSQALLKGLEFIRPKMKELADTGHHIAPGGEAMMHCWRGGMRSNSMAWLMNTVGIKTYTLVGGYRSYRRFEAEYFSRPVNLIVLGGMTGSGKTAVLKELNFRGNQIIDLEDLASHKGSVFGGIGMPDQPSTEQFENYLFFRIMHIDTGQPVFIEDESLAIGKVFIPRSFYDQMSTAESIHLMVPFERRVENLVHEYSGGGSIDLATGVMRIERRLGRENAVKAVDLINRGDMTAATVLILKYYDKIYARSMNRHKRKTIQTIRVNHESPGEIAEIIISNLKNGTKTYSIQSGRRMWVQNKSG